MSTVVNEVLTANQRYASNFGNKGNLPMPPGRHFVILTCMDARLDPAQYAGLAEGDAHVIRNAGGHASDDASRASTPAAGTMRAAADRPKASTSAGSPFPIRSRVCSKTCTHPRPLVPGNVPIYGYIYDVKSNKLVEGPPLRRAGRDSSSGRRRLAHSFRRLTACRAYRVGATRAFDEATSRTASGPPLSHRGTTRAFSPLPSTRTRMPSRRRPSVGCVIVTRPPVTMSTVTRCASFLAILLWA